jgi:glutathione S-transferase
MEAATKLEPNARTGPAQPPVLYQLEISHYNEKARWALDYKGIAHVRKTQTPFAHLVVAFALTRGVTLPVLKLHGKAIGDSTRIIAALEREQPDPPLYPDDSAERRRALELEEHFDEQLGPHIRRFVFQEAFEGLSSRDFVEGAMASAPRAVKATMRATAPVGRRAMRLRYGIDRQRADAGRQKMEAALDHIEAELQPSGYLVGDRFTVADLTACALLFPLVRPPEAQYLMPPPLPPGFERVRESVSSHRAFEWVGEIYRRHRGRSAAIAC